MANKSMKNALVNFNSFQKSQIDTLDKISKSLGTNLESSFSVQDSLASIRDAMESMTKTTKSLEVERINFQGQMQRRELELKDQLSKRQLQKIKLEEDTIAEAMRKIEEAGDSLDAKKFEEYRQTIETSIKQEEIKLDTDNKMIDSTKQLLGKFKDLAVKVADVSNKYSQLSNNMITVSGADAESVRSTREDIVRGVVSELNSQTGYYFRGDESYEKIINAASAAGVGNLESIEEMSRPLILAMESMDVSGGDLATTLNRLYTRYNFSSSEMEGLLDDIKGNTANNNATAEATMNNINTLQNYLELYAAGDSEKLSQMIESLSESTSWLENMNVDSARYTDIAKKIMTGEAFTDRSIISMLSAGGSSLDEVYKEAISGNLSAVYESIMEGESALYESALSGTRLKSQVAGAYEYDLDSLVDSYNARNYNESYSTLKEFTKSTKNNETMVESVDGKFNTALDRFSNIFNVISEGFANIQERWGYFSISDVVTALTSIATLVSMRNIGSSLSKLGSGSPISNLGSGAGSSLLSGLQTLGTTTGLRGLDTTPAALSGASSGLAKIAGLGGGLGGTAMLAGGVAAGGLLAADGIQGLIDEGSSGAEKALSGLELATGAGGALAVAALGVTNPIGWAALAVGGLSFLGKKAVENATELSGNAEAISAEIDSIGDSLKSENKDRLKQISDLSYNFDRAETLQEKKNLMEESGLFDREDLLGKQEDELDSMIDSYKRATAAMDSVTDSALAIAKKYSEDKVDEQQKEFIQELKGITNVTDRASQLELLMGGVTDEKLLAKMKKALNDNMVDDYEWNDIIYGGNDSWFDKHNLTDQTIDNTTMQLSAGFSGFSGDYTDYSDQYTLAGELLARLKNATTKEEFDSIVSEITPDLEDIINGMSPGIIDKTRQINGYKIGTNYINSDQFAVLHEGEAVVPKAYNPTANITELEMLRSYYKESNNKDNSVNNAGIEDIKSLLSEIKEFLSYWRDDNINRDITKSSMNRLSNSATRYVTQYMTSN